MAARTGVVDFIKYHNISIFPKKCSFYIEQKNLEINMTKNMKFEILEV